MNRMSKASALIAICLVGWWSGSAVAHDGAWSLDIDDWGTYNVTHEDADPWKGFASFTVKNSSQSNYWTDFHFQVFAASGDATLVAILDPPTPTTSQSPYTYVIGSTPQGLATLDYYFPLDPVGPGETATFTFYTENTAVPNLWFGLCMVPTPEPGSLALLAIGGLLVLRKRR